MSGEKLSKRHGAVSVGEYQTNGYSPTALLNFLVRFGWSSGDEEIFSLDEMIQKFDWASCNKSDGKFNAQKLVSINHEHLKNERLTTAARYVENVRPFVEARGLAADAEKLALTAPLVREKARSYVEAAEALDFFFREPPAFDEKAVTKFLVPANAPNLDALADLLAALPTFDVPTIEASVHRWLEEKGLQIKDVAQPARVALTGRTASPGIYETLAALGQTTSVGRLRAGADKARGAAT
jgi:glutamyl-tRNA synthetase